jgi:hypothetical protein
MIRIAHWTVTILIILLGVVHSVMTFTCMDFNEDALWFLGSGLAIILAGLINVLLITNYSSLTQSLTVTVNIVIAILFAVAIKLAPQAGAYVGLGLFSFAIILTLIAHYGTFDDVLEENI